MRKRGRLILDFLGRDVILLRGGVDDFKRLGVKGRINLLVFLRRFRGQCTFPFEW